MTEFPDSDHDIYGDWAAAYSLGALDSDDRRDFETHLEGCEVCQAEVAAFAPLPGLIARIEPADLDHQISSDRLSSIGAAARSEHQALRRRERGWRVAAAAAGIAAAVLAVLLFLPKGGTTPAPVATAVTTNLADRAEVWTTPRPWGTEITVELTGLPLRGDYRLWAIDDEGGWTSAASWAATPNGTANLTGATSTPTERIERIVVTSSDKADVLVEAST